MAHSEKRSSPLREFQIAVFTGALYGAAHTVSGHPLDNLKTAMQLDVSYRNLGASAAARRLWKTNGARGFTRGIVPPLIGSSFYRSVMMSTYEASYTWFDRESPEDSFWKREYAGGYIPRPCVFLSALFCSVARAVVEAPFEQAKVMRQTGRPWSFSLKLYRGAGLQTARTTGLLVAIFGPFDVIRQKTEWLERGITAQWAVSTVVCGAAYAVVWPLETLKNMAQAGLPRPGASLLVRIEHLGGLRGLYRGALPGICGGGFRNGMGMLAMANAQRAVTLLGLRD